MLLLNDLVKSWFYKLHFLLPLIFIVGCQTLQHPHEELSSPQADATAQNRSATGDPVDKATALPGSQPKDVICRDSLYSQYLIQEYQQKHAADSPHERHKWKNNRAVSYALSRMSPRDDAMGSIPLVSNPHVDFWIKYYKTTGRQTFIKWLIRAESIKSIIVPLLQEQGMPAELFYLAMIESGLSNRAFSRAQASGLWQFVTGTANMYGLKMNYWFDERRDPIKATVAASTYLRDLYDRFGDWYLALAAYNSGPGRVNRAIRKAGSKDFWVLSQKKLLNKETRNYIPKIIAAIILASNPTRHGFLIQKDPGNDFPDDFVLLKNPHRLTDIAALIGISHTQLQHWNPEIRKGITPPLQWTQAEGYPLRLMENHVQTFHEKKANLVAVKVKDVHMHRVSSGDTLFGIARKYNVTVKKLKNFNPKISPQRLRIGKLVAVPIISIQ